MSTVGEFQPLWLVVAVAAAAVSMACFARTQRRMLAAGGTRVSIHRMIGLAYAANAVNWTLPGGTALSAGYVVRQLRRWGASTAAAGFTVVASGALSAASFAALALVVGSLGGPGGTGSLLALAVPAVLVCGAVALCRYRPVGRVEALAARAARLVRRDPERGRAAVRRVLADLTAIHPRRRDWAVGLVFSAGNWLADLVCLAASCRAVGAGMPTLTVLLVSYVVGMTAAGVSVVPGGLGVVDVAMIATLAGGGLGPAAATASIVAYRVVSCALVVVVGWVVWLLFRHARTPTVEDGSGRDQPSRMASVASPRRCASSPSVNQP